MIRDTSIEVYNRIKEEGLLSLRRQQVYSVLFEHGPLTGAQTAKIVKEFYGSWGHSETIRNRLTELRDLGCVKELDKKPCPINGNVVIVWDVTSKIPVETKKKESNAQKIKRLESTIEELNKKIKYLEQELNFSCK